MCESIRSSLAAGLLDNGLWIQSKWPLDPKSHEVTPVHEKLLTRIFVAFAVRDFDLASITSWQLAEIGRICAWLVPVDMIKYSRTMLINRDCNNMTCMACVICSRRLFVGPININNTESDLWKKKKNDRIQLAQTDHFIVSHCVFWGSFITGGFTKRHTKHSTAIHWACLQTWIELCWKTPVQKSIFLVEQNHGVYGMQSTVGHRNTQHSMSEPDAQPAMCCLVLHTLVYQPETCTEAMFRLCYGPTCTKTWALSIQNT